MLEQELKQCIDNIESLLKDVQQVTSIRPSRGQMLEESTVTDTIADQVGNAQHERRMNVLPPSSLTSARPDPLDHVEERSSIWTERQHSLIWYYETFGVIGLAYKVKEVARAEIVKDSGEEPKVPTLYRKQILPVKRNAHSANVEVEDSQREEASSSPNTLKEELVSLVEQGPGSKSWRRIFYDWYQSGQSRMLYYLSAIPDEVMRAILHGNLPQRMSDTSFAERYDAFVKLTENPGTYSMYIARKAPSARSAMPSSLSPGEHPSALGLTLREIQGVCTAASKYIDTDREDFLNHVKAIDSAIGNFQDKLDYRDQRRYGASTGKDNFAPHEDFLEHLNTNLVGWAKSLRDSGHADALHVPLDRCLVHVGLSGNPLRRCSMHWTHNSDPSPIFGMVTAILRAAWKDRFDVRHSSYQIFRVVDSDELGFAEILSSIISSSYYWDLGLSLTYAGSGGKGRAYKNDKQLQSKFAANARALRDENVQVSQLTASVDKMKKMEAATQRDINQLRREAQSCTESLTRDSAVLQELRETVERQRLALRLHALEEGLCRGLNGGDVSTG